MPTYPATKADSKSSTGLPTVSATGGLKPSPTGNIPLNPLFPVASRLFDPPTPPRGTTTPAPGQPANSEPSSLSPVAKTPVPVSTGTPTTKATSAATVPATAGNVRSATTIAAPDRDAADTGDVSSAVFNADITGIDNAIKTMQTTNARQNQQIDSLTKQIATVQSQIGQSQIAAATSVGATAAGTGATGATTQTAGKIGTFLTSTTGKLVIVAVLAVGGWYYLRQNGGVGGFFKEPEEGESNA